MSANVETMFYNREVPWHGLGTKVEEALTSEEALRIAGLDWKVLPTEIRNTFNNEMIPGVFANTRDSDGKVLGIASDRYKIVQNAEAFSFTDALLNNRKQRVRYETAGSLNGGKTVWMLAQMPAIEIVGDKVENYLCFSNSHDGKNAVHIACTPVRVVCQNTLNLALKDAKRSWSTKHIGNMDEKMKEASRTLELNSKYMDLLKEEAERLAMEKYSEKVFESFVTHLFPYKDGSDKQTEKIDAMREGLRSRYFDMEDLSDLRGTKWGVIQAVSDFATHRKPIRLTNTYQEKMFASVLDGNALIDSAYSLLAA